ncbi:cellulose synthase/poly-beta-1,6-N-acetylglucosamine synthase-like glycosyltransferase [Sphingomonas sp. BE138]|uniref:glycosyltransferase n=1 Tax=Sphingomonas sp. BE138 TaxID=2817845 RepID=UPI00285FE96A|nr:glycosyltransferase [Sphingomonas sp. BE138]MDR6788483.1 cellulose synthase/poly-beta-1,6-N-acetylglucosamine synthase-like glycosyltransferase [Sphingomonas sp. BE138]
MTWVCAIIAALLLVLAVHPFLIYPLTLRLFPRRPLAPLSRDGTYRPTLAICMSAYNEARSIRRRMERLVEAAEVYGNATIHVYADGPQDGTIEILREFADRIDLIVSYERKGKTFGMNQLVARSTSDLLMFTDANVLHDPQVIAPLVAPFADPDVGCVSARLIYSNADDSPAAATGAAYWRAEESIKAIESGTVGLIGVDGAMFALRRDLHRAPPPHLIDDLYLSLMVLAQNKRVVNAPDALVYERSATAADEELVRKRRIACQAINVHRTLWPQLRRLPWPALYGYISHRMLKWMTPFLLAGAMLFALPVAIALLGAEAVVLLAGGVVLALAAGHALHIGPAQRIVTAILSLAGVAMGVIDSVAGGKTYAVWAPAESVRD